MVLKELEERLDREIDKGAFQKVGNVGSRVLRSFQHYHLIFYRDLIEYVTSIKEKSFSMEEALSKEMIYVGEKAAKLIVLHLQEQGFIDYFDKGHKQLLLFDEKILAK